MSYNTEYRYCYKCSGTGRIETNQYNTRYNSGRGVYQRVCQRVTSSCYQCSGRGRVLDQYRTYLNKRQRQNQQRKIKQKQRIAEQKRKQQQELKNKQKRFKQYVKKYQNQLNKPLLQDVQQYSSEESQQYESPNQWLIQKVQIMSFQKQNRVIYCGVCAGTGQQRIYLSKEINTCSNCKGSGKIILNQQSQPQFVLLKQQLNINNEPKDIKNEQKNKLIFCGTCAGKGYEKVQMSHEIRKCQNCDGMGKLALNQNDFPQKIKYQGYENQAKKLQQNYKKAKQKQVKKNKKILIKNRNKNIWPPKIKSEEQLRKQFQKVQEDQRLNQQRKKWRQEYQYRKRMEILRKNLEQKEKKQKQQKDRKWQQFIKTPQGIKQIKKQQRQKKINNCIEKICCGPPSCKRVYQWCIISIAIFFTVYMFVNYY